LTVQYTFPVAIDCTKIWLYPRFISWGVLC